MAFPPSPTSHPQVSSLTHFVAAPTDFSHKSTLGVDSVQVFLGSQSWGGQARGGGKGHGCALVPAASPGWAGAGEQNGNTAQAAA